MLQKARRVLNRFMVDEQGLEVVEYAVIAAFIVIGTVATVALVMLALNQKFTDLELVIQGP